MQTVIRIKPQAAQPGRRDHARGVLPCALLTGGSLPFVPATSRASTLRDSWSLGRMPAGHEGELHVASRFLAPHCGPGGLPGEDLWSSHQGDGIKRPRPPVRDSEVAPCWLVSEHRLNSRCHQRGVLRRPSMLGVSRLQVFF